MRKIVWALVISVLASAPALAASCKADAAEKKLACAALKSFMTKCQNDAKTSCEADSVAKKLAGAAKTSHNKKCVTDKVGS
jgi:hypothetical protein